MRKKAWEKQIIFFLIILGIFSIGRGAFAALEVAWPNSPLGTALNENTDISSLIKYFYDWGISLGGFAAFIVLVVAGLQYMTSAGNPGKMSEAIHRIRDAVIGLLLLLGSFLILNTINPQLTTIEIPSDFPNPEAWSIQVDPGKELALEKSECTSVQLYGGTDYQAEHSFSPLSAGEKKSFNSTEINSVLFDGRCQLTLYRLANFDANADNPPLVIYGDVPNMAAFGETRFRSAQLIDFSNF